MMFAIPGMRSKSLGNFFSVACNIGVVCVGLSVETSVAAVQTQGSVARLRKRCLEFAKAIGRRNGEVDRGI